VVTFTAPASGASGTFANGQATATATTNNSGIASSPAFTANSTVGGPYTVMATVSGVNTSVSYALINSADPVVTATAGYGQGALINTAFPTLLKASAILQGQGPFTVIFTAPASGASGTFAGGSNTASVTTDATGVATAPAFTANGTTGVYQITATVGIASASFDMVNVSPTSSPFGAGNYVFSLSGTDANASFYNVGGVFAINADGLITGGYQTFADAVSTEPYEPISASGALVSTSNGNVRILLNTGNPKIGVGGSGEEVFDASVVSSSKAWLTEFDTWATGSGELQAQSLPSGNLLCTASSCSYAFLTAGKIPASTLPFAMGGIFSLNSSSAISSGVFDANIEPGGTQYLDETISGGSFTSFNSFGVLQLTLNANPLAADVGFDAYIIDSSHVRLIESDGVRVVSGVVLAQTGTSLASICTSGSNYVIGMNGEDLKGVLQVAGMFTMPTSSSSNIGGVINFNDPSAAGTQSPLAITGGSCTPDTTYLGRVALGDVAIQDSGASHNFQFYVTGDSDGDVLALTLDSTDTVAGHGYQQTGGPFTSGGFSGTYAIDATGVNNINSTVTTVDEFDAVGAVTANGGGTISGNGTVDLNWIFNTGPTTGLSVTSGSYSANSNGVFTGALTGLDVASSGTSDAFSYYLVDNAGTNGSSSRVIAIETDANQLSLDFLEQK
jgi:hypothetical protein